SGPSPSDVIITGFYSIFYKCLREEAAQLFRGGGN
ncbi:unnamed protein product, partial [Allacma fusca]